MEEELERSNKVISDPRRQVLGHKATYTFSEEYLASDDIVRFYTGLSNMKALFKGSV